MAEPLRLGIAGLGTVGSGLVKLVQERARELADSGMREITIAGVSARDRSKERGIDISAYEWFDEPAELARDANVDVFVELIGGEDGIAKRCVEAALDSGKHVVTANKALLAHHAVSLAALAEEKGVSLNFEAAIAGGIPVVKAMRESLLGNTISRVYGILNGTCNYILTCMEREGRAFNDVLEDAQKAGYAEADPTFDIGGHDTAHKLSLLTTLAFGTQTAFDSIYLEGIESITPADIAAAEELGYRIKLLGVAMRTETGIEQRVHPTMVE
ncbi:MAG: homoserine dehydrogenase, partial [Alphaproteobacteria bacterium]